MLNISYRGYIVMLYPFKATRITAKAITLSSSMLLPLLLLVPASPISTAPIPTATAQVQDVGIDDNNDTSTVSKDKTSGEVAVYSIWVQENGTGGNPDVFFAKSDDGGETFGNPINLSNNEEWSTDPKIAVADNHVHVVWRDFDWSPGQGPPSEESKSIVTVRSSDDGGESFADAVLVGERDVGEPFSRHNILQIDATTTADDKNNDHKDDGSNVYISWVAGGGGEFAGHLNFAKSDDSGQSFELLTKLVQGVDDIEMEVAASDDDNTDNIYIAGQASSQNDITLTNQIFFLKSTDGGKTFDDPILLEDVDPDEGDSIRFESLEVDNNEIQVTWIRHNPDTEETHFAVSTNGGETWG